MSGIKKYLNYIVFIGGVGAVTLIAINHSRYISRLVTDMSSSDSRVRTEGALGLLKTEQFGDSIAGEEPPARLGAVQALITVANDTTIVVGSEKDAPDYRGQAVKQLAALLKDTDRKVRTATIEAMKKVDMSAPGNLTAMVNAIGDGDTAAAAADGKKIVMFGHCVRMRADRGENHGEYNGHLNGSWHREEHW